METTTIPVKGMTCGGCVASVTRVLKGVPGVDSVVVTLNPAEAKALPLELEEDFVEATTPLFSAELSVPGNPSVDLDTGNSSGHDTAWRLEIDGLLPESSYAVH